VVVLAVVPLVGVSTVWYYARAPRTVVSQPRRSGAVGVDETTAPPAPSYPSVWDPRVADIAKFVAQERGLTFTHPVNVDFLTTEQYHDAAIAGEHEPTTEQADPDAGFMTDDDIVAEFRAFGLISGAVDLSAVDDTLVGSGTLAYYSPRDKRVRVQGSEMTPRLRVTLAHELTHALQDQNFDLTLGPINRATTYRPILEGDATRIEWAYAATVLSDAERAQLAEADEAGRRAYYAVMATSNVPTVLATAFELPYAIGPQFVDIAAAQGGNSAVDAFTIYPPLSEVELLDPLRADVDDTVATVRNPPLPGGTEVLDRSPLGAGLLFLLLGERMEPAAAFDAASTWQGEALVVSRQHGRICVDADFVTGPTTGATLLSGMTAWATGMPPEAGAAVSGDAYEVRVHTCDPGADVAFTVADRTDKTLRYVSIRSEIGLELLRDSKLTSKRSACIADEAARTISAADLASDSFDVLDDPELVDAIHRAALTC
jgi:hypothetical protein